MTDNLISPVSLMCISAGSSLEAGSSLDAGSSLETGSSLEAGLSLKSRARRGAICDGQFNIARQFLRWFEMKQDWSQPARPYMKVTIDWKNPFLSLIC